MKNSTKAMALALALAGGLALPALAAENEGGAPADAPVVTEAQQAQQLIDVLAKTPSADARKKILEAALKNNPRLALALLKLASEQAASGTPESPVTTAFAKSLYQDILSVLASLPETGKVLEEVTSTYSEQLAANSADIEPAAGDEQPQVAQTGGNDFAPATGDSGAAEQENPNQLGTDTGTGTPASPSGPVL